MVHISEEEKEKWKSKSSRTIKTNTELEEERDMDGRKGGGGFVAGKTKVQWAIDSHRIGRSNRGGGGPGGGRGNDRVSIIGS